MQQIRIKTEQECHQLQIESPGATAIAGTFAMMYDTYAQTGTQHDEPTSEL
jgi:hypothetical protein